MFGYRDIYEQMYCIQDIAAIRFYSVLGFTFSNTFLKS
jgi:hypothetical protein